MKSHKKFTRTIAFTLALMIAGGAMCMPVSAAENDSANSAVVEEQNTAENQDEATDNESNENAESEKTLSDKMRDVAKSDPVQDTIDMMERIGPISQNEDGTINVTVTEEDKEKVKNILEIVCDAIADFLTMLLEAFADIFNEVIAEDPESTSPSAE